MPKKPKKQPKQYPIGTFQTTGNKRKLFIHAFPNPSNTLLYRKGLHAEIEARMLEHPGEQVSKAHFEKKYNTRSESIVTIAKKIEKHHNLPARKRGGPRFRITREGEKIIERFYMSAVRKKEKKVIVWEIIKEIAKVTGVALTSSTIYNKIIALEMKHNKGIRTSIAGITGISSQQIVKKLKEEGIEAAGRSYRNYPIL